MLDLDRDIVVMFDDAHKAEAEHLPVNVLAILGNDSLPRQHLLADFMVAFAGLALHPARLGSVFVEVIAVRWHILVNMPENTLTGKGVSTTGRKLLRCRFKRADCKR